MGDRITKVDESGLDAAGSGRPAVQDPASTRTEEVPMLSRAAPSRTSRSGRRRAPLGTALAVALVVANGIAWQARTTPAALFLPAESPPASVLPSPADAGDQPLRRRFAGLDRARLEHARVEVGRPGAPPPALRLNLFDDAVLTAVFDHSAPTSSGYSLAGRIDGFPLGSVILVANRDVVAGTVRTPHARYDIRTAPDGRVAIQQFAPRGLPPDNGTLPRRVPSAPTPPAPARATPIRAPLPASAADPSSGEPEDGSRFDILVVYTPAARDGAGGTRAVEALIDLFIATANRAFADSGVIPRLHLTQALEVDYVEAGNYGRDLTQLANEHNGDLGEVHEIRNLQAADLVHILVEEHEPTGAYRDCGLAGGNQWALPFEPPYRFHPFEASFALTVRTPWCDPPMVFAHEVGHNLGMVHDRYVGRVGFHERPHHPYAFGYVNQRTFEPGAPASSRWMTLMAVNYQCGHAGFGCTHIIRFSNPDRTWLGYPTGVAYRGGGFTTRVDGPADATRVINLTRHVVANIRPAPCLRVGQWPTVGLQASNGQFVGAHYAGGGPVTADREALEPWAGFHFEDENGGCVDAGDIVSLRTQHGFYLRAEGGGGGAVDATATTAGPSERFMIHRIGAQWVRTANIHNDNIAVRPGDLVTLQAASGHFVVAEQGGGGGVRADRRSATAWGRFRVANVDAFVPLPDATAAIQPSSP